MCVCVWCVCWSITNCKFIWIYFIFIGKFVYSAVVVVFHKNFHLLRQPHNSWLLLLDEWTCGPSRFFSSSNFHIFVQHNYLPLGNSWWTNANASYPWHVHIEWWHETGNTTNEIENQLTYCISGIEDTFHLMSCIHRRDFFFFSFFHCDQLIQCNIFLNWRRIGV